jgi:hypothetical protein
MLESEHCGRQDQPDQETALVDAERTSTTPTLQLDVPGLEKLQRTRLAVRLEEALARPTVGLYVCLCNGKVKIKCKM